MGFTLAYLEERDFLKLARASFSMNALISFAFYMNTYLTA